jgi:hypothetical protein
MLAAVNKASYCRKSTAGTLTWTAIVAGDS